MKKALFFVTMALFAFVFVVANNNVKEEKKVTKDVSLTESIIYTSVQYVNSNEIAPPYTINVPVPSGTVKGVSGPCNATMKNWEVNGGILSIHYTNRADIECLQDPWTYYIEYVTVEGQKYRATIVSE